VAASPLFAEAICRSRYGKITSRIIFSSFCSATFRFLRNFLRWSFDHDPTSVLKLLSVLKRAVAIWHPDAGASDQWTVPDMRLPAGVGCDSREVLSSARFSRTPFSSAALASGLKRRYRRTRNVGSCPFSVEVTLKQCANLIQRGAIKWQI
jgi:hypothetical protein